MGWNGCETCGFKHRFHEECYICWARGASGIQHKAPPDMDPDPRLIHDAVLPEVVGDYEAAEAGQQQDERRTLMFGNKERDKERDKQIKRHRAQLFDLNGRVFSLKCKVPRVFALARSNQRDIDENEKAIALILRHLDLEYTIIPRHPELVPRETVDPE